MWNRKVEIVRKIKYISCYSLEDIRKDTDRNGHQIVYVPEPPSSLP